MEANRLVYKKTFVLKNEIVSFKFQLLLFLLLQRGHDSEAVPITKV